eukprot:SAG31_NODE_4544_length_3150_cov_1.620125_6_plen_110_part_00
MFSIILIEVPAKFSTVVLNLNLERAPVLNLVPGQSCPPAQPKPRSQAAQGCQREVSAPESAPCTRSPLALPRRGASGRDGGDQEGSQRSGRARELADPDPEGGGEVKDL